MTTLMRMPFATWVAANPIPHTSYYAPLARQQLEMVHARATQCLQDCEPGASIFVRGTHTRRRLTLPVIEFHVPHLVRIFTRGNFDDWAVTVDAKRAVQPLDLSDLNFFNLDPTWFQGFRESGLEVFGGYGQPSFTQFSFHYWGVSDKFPNVLRRIIEGTKASASPA